MVVVCIIFGVLIAVCLVTIFALLRANDGFEDAAGFHEIASPAESKAVVISRQIKIQVPQEPVSAELELAAD